MRLPLSWLAEFIDLPTSDPATLAAVLGSLGHEVEGWETTGPSFTGVVVGRVETVRPHPDADRVRLTQVDDGSGELHEVVCGAWNFDAGAVVAFAPVGARLNPGGRPMEIEARSVRGVVSQGMICSASELGLGEDHTGILVLDELGVAGPEEVGRDLEAVLPLSDVVLDLTITPNRPDAMSVLGIARELGAYYELPVRQPDTHVEETGPDIIVRVDVEDPVGCPRFVARQVSGVKVAPSPLPMQLRLRAAGVRPISNVVDVSNYVMIEMGHPIHTFDLERVSEGRLIIRRAREGEGLRTLDGIDRELVAEDIVVADPSGAVALAGVMGGESSEVSESTSQVLVEAANWDPASVLATAHRLGLRSEASARFERGVDPNLSGEAATRAASMVASLGGGQVHRGAVDVYPAPAEMRRIDLRLAEVERLLGPGLDAATAGGLLTRLGFEVTADDGSLEVLVPTRRPDVTRPVDLVEEVARLHGYERFPSRVRMGPDGTVAPEQRAERVVREAMVGAGYFEAQSMSFFGAGDLDLLRLPADDPRRDAIRVSNPLRDEESLLRTTLLPGLLRAAAGNLDRGSRAVSLFEVGKVFRPAPSALDPMLPDQPNHLAFVAVGERGSTGILGARREVDVYEATALVRLLGGVRGIDLRVYPGEQPPFHPGRAGMVLLDKEVVGWAGELHPAVSRGFGLPGRVAAGEIELAPLLTVAGLWQLRPVSPFPPVKLDVAFDAGPGVLTADLLDRMGDAIGDLLEASEVFDVFVGPGMEAGRRSIAIRLTLRAPDRTLRDDEVTPLLRQAVVSVEQWLDVRLRGSV
jgi:phenylalanyl-tRNA synthetase beta chain